MLLLLRKLFRRAEPAPPRPSDRVESVYRPTTARALRHGACDRQRLVAGNSESDTTDSVSSVSTVGGGAPPADLYEMTGFAATATFDEEADLFEDDGTRTSLFPIRHADLWGMYKKAVASFWTVDEVDLSRDIIDWKTKLDEGERRYVKTVLAFFLGADRLVNDNLLRNVSSVVKLFEAQYFYQFQVAVENVHTETYNILMDTFVEDEFEKERAFRSVEDSASIKRKYDWCRRWTDDRTVSFCERVIAFACVEGIFFSSSFAAIFWLKKRGLMHGLCFSNELISRDEGLHCEFAVMVYKNYTPRDVETASVRRIVREACAAELIFVDEAMPDGLVGLTRDQMRDYVVYISERLMIDLTGERMNPDAPLPTNPLDFMDNIALQGKTNFFERKVSEYRAATAGGAAADTGDEDDGVDNLIGALTRQGTGGEESSLESL